MCVLYVLALELWECIYQQQHSPSCPRGPETLKAPLVPMSAHAHAACHWIALVSIVKLKTMLLQINQ